MVATIVSGGQTGADRAALDAAIETRTPHSGWCPLGRRAEDGRIPGHYNLRETRTADYLERTELNAKESDGTVIFTSGPLGGGSKRTADFSRKHGKPWMHIDVRALRPEDIPIMLRVFVESNKINVLNIAGTRGSKDPVIYEKTKRALVSFLNR